MALGDGEWLDAEIHREHGLIGHRMNWYVASQSFLLTAYTIVFNPQNELMPVARWLLPGVSIAVSLVTWLALVAACVTMFKLRKRQSEVAAEAFRKFWCEGRRAFHITGMAPPVIIPLLFTATWVVLWIRTS